MGEHTLRRRAAAGGLALALLLTPALTGCSSMLDRSYSEETLHVQFSDEAANSAILRAESYQGLLSALLHLVSDGVETGVIHLYNYLSVTGGAASDVDQACLELTKQDPLGAYAVQYMKYNVTQSTAYYEVSVKIVYRRTPEQIRSVVSVTGSGAIGEELGAVFAEHQREAVFRIGYFAQDDSAQAIRQAAEAAYLSVAGAGAPMPAIVVNLYPDSGQQRVAELLFTWPEGTENGQTP